MSPTTIYGNRPRYNIGVVSTEGSAGEPALKRFSRKGYSRVKNIGTKTGAALVAFMVAGLMLLGPRRASMASQRF